MTAHSREGRVQRGIASGTLGAIAICAALAVSFGSPADARGGALPQQADVECPTTWSLEVNPWYQQPIPPVPGQYFVPTVSNPVLYVIFNEAGPLIGDGVTDMRGTTIPAPDPLVDVVLCKEDIVDGTTTVPPTTAPPTTAPPTTAPPTTAPPTTAPPTTAPPSSVSPTTSPPEPTTTPETTSPATTAPPTTTPPTGVLPESSIITESSGVPTVPGPNPGDRLPATGSSGNNDVLSLALAMLGGGLLLISFARRRGHSTS